MSAVDDALAASMLLVQEVESHADGRTLLKAAHDAHSKIAAAQRERQRAEEPIPFRPAAHVPRLPQPYRHIDLTEPKES